MHMGPVRPVINIFLHDLCIINPQNDPKNRDISKKPLKSRDFTTRVSKLYKVSSFKIFFKN